MRNKPIDRRIFRLYDEYCHGRISRREFFDRAAKVTVAGVTGLAMAEALLPNYAAAQTISFTPNTSNTPRPAAIRERCAATSSPRRAKARSRPCS